MPRSYRLRARAPSKLDAALPIVVLLTTVSVALTTVLVLFAAGTGRLSANRTFALGRLRESDIHALCQSFTECLLHMSTHLPVAAFEDDDVPIFYPMLDLPGHADVDQRPLVKIGFEETVHFDWDNSTSAREYFQMIPFGSVGQRHGRQNRAFATAVSLHH